MSEPAVLVSLRKLYMGFGYSTKGIFRLIGHRDLFNQVAEKEWTAFVGAGDIEEIMNSLEISSQTVNHFIHRT